MNNLNSSNDPNINGWNEWSKYVLKELERLNVCYEKLDTRLDTITTDLALLKAKAGVWGLLGGLIPVAMMIGWMLLKQK